MRLTGVSPESGGTGLTVRTTLANPSTRPGLRLPGRVDLVAGAVDVPVFHVRLGLVSTVEPDDPEAPRRLVQFHQAQVAEALLLRAGQARSIPFEFPLPWETPVTTLGGTPLLSLRMGLRTEVAIEPALDQGAMVPVFVHPLPTQQQVLAALDALGFRVRQAGLVDGRLPAVDQALPLHQRWGFWVGPLYAGPITELEVIFVANSAGIEVILWCDRRLALAGITHTSISRFRSWHAGADQRDWVTTVDGWLREAINRHAAAASHADWSAPITHSAHVSRSPDEPIPPGFGLGGTAGGAGVGGGGGDGT
ncbi:Sporulation-control protein spo0M [Micromonospora phaseoli]|uniref:Sporulation-control protein spo0M n=1 Tax=Micromonospora phaseoli TaxID=1144548 RepID=A0A1H6RW93_9ACTN|nr:sporulation protein [Micromonospora phaseoli]PZW03566.1 sporulation-control protein spo0M [Micromonospora phaseoli]GIJ77132.1 sporulation protein [Micromonospora phaseoli]SEI56807.1 Sporulation-control protein spo0M [Micromonospora phaseoli]